MSIRINRHKISPVSIFRRVALNTDRGRARRRKNLRRLLLEGCFVYIPIARDMRKDKCFGRPPVPAAELGRWKSESSFCKAFAVILVLLLTTVFRSRELILVQNG